MKAEIIRVSELSRDLKNSWSRIQSSEQNLASPFFCPEFTAAVAAVIDDVRVAVLQANAETGFFPFELAAPKMARAVGNRLSDYHGVIASPNLAWTAAELLSSCGLQSYQFKNLIASQNQFRKFHQRLAFSAVIQLERGFDAYAARIRARGSKLLKKVAACRRRIERDIGPLRLEPHSSMPQSLAWLETRKSAQYLRTGLPDKFQVPCTRNLLANLHQTHTPQFAGMLSLLWAGDRIIAAHFGLRSPRVLHYWFPAYECAFRQYSPGLVLLMELVRHANSLGIEAIDLGRADAEYKLRVMTGGVALAEGIVETSAATAQWGPMHADLARV
jgi:CelD/BcsL family acetyltransferase involved in cellulose biosynthesis